MRKRRTFVLGDLHGGYKALMQVLNAVEFNYRIDVLIFLGDILDGWDEHDLIIEEFNKIKFFYPILGNHDYVMLDWIDTGIHKFKWSHGGESVIQAYERINGKDYKIKPLTSGGYSTTLTPQDIPKSHSKYFRSAFPFHLDDEGRLFIHAGMNPDLTIEDHRPEMKLDVFAWDSSLIYNAEFKHKNGYPPVVFKDERIKKVFVGHTLVGLNNEYKPLICDNLVGLDTGAGYKGRVTLMNVDTLEYIQSDEVWTLYPHLKGRNH